MNVASEKAPGLVEDHGKAAAQDLSRRRFAGLERLYGVAGAARIRSAHVMVVGIGGVGSWSVEALARSGVERMTLIDFDHIAESNINRQIHALETTLGQSKIEAMRERILQINPACEILPIDDFVDPDNWLSFVERAVRAQGELDAVIDACDQLKAKRAMAAWAREKRVKHETGRFPTFVTVGAAGGKRHAHRVEIDDLSLVTHDPLLAQLRHRLRKEDGAPRDGKKMGVACVFSRESVAAPDASCATAEDGSLNCSGYGSAVSVTATFGQCAAGWIIDKLAGSNAL
jgi:tRNA A37 threonylcarbamoyladenosine dehydratase